MVQLPTSYDHHRLRYRMQDVILLTKSNAQLTVRSPLYGLTISGENLIYNKIDTIW